MQKSPIEWTDRTWNAVTGCNNGCPYCYARKLASTRLRGRFGYPQDNPFAPTFHIDKINEPKKLKKPSRIFVSSMGDLFGGGVPEHWIQAVLDTIEECPQHTFQLLTKNPARYEYFDIPQNTWMGYSTTGQLYHKWDARNADRFKFVSLEPIMSPLKGSLQGIDLLIVGAETGTRPEKITPDSWGCPEGSIDCTTIKGIINKCDESGTMLYLKDSMKPFCRSLDMTKYKNLP